MRGLRLRGSIWWISYSANGKRIREGVGPSKSLAKEVLAKRKSEISEGRFFDHRKTKGVTFKTITEKYWEMHGQHLRSGSWQYMLKEVADRFEYKAAGDISVADVQAYYNEIRARASISTANRHLTLLKSVFNRAIAWELFRGDNPAAKINKVQEPPNRLRYLSQPELLALLRSCDNRISPLITCALLTGMRRGEIMSLTWANVDLSQGLIYILQSKSGRGREIPIAPNLHTVFADMGPKEPTAKVFDVPDITLRRHFDLALNAAGITGFRFHDLRHTFASYFIMKTGNLPALQKILGHATPMMTQRYAHLSSGYLQAEMRAFNSCIPDAGEVSQEINIKGHNLGTITKPEALKIPIMSMKMPT